MGDTVRLTLRSDDSEDPANADLGALERHFEVLQRSSSVSTRIVNGERTQTRELLLELTPRREGSIVIPAFEINGQRSEALAIEVGPEPKARAADEVVIFEAEVDRDEVYVQGQILLTLRVQQAVNLESRSITELEIENAYVETLGQNSFQRTIDGRPWLVHEIRYAIFPEASGELRIPAQTFSGRVGAGRRTLFDTRPAGRLERRRTQELVVPVLPRPDDYPTSTWLPAADLSIEEQWSGPLDQLRIGDSVTRTVTVTAKGLQGAQLPPLGDETAAGLRVYPDQPGISNVSGEGGLTGVRTDSLALVAVNDGEFELPAVEIPWWDTGSNTLRVARLPARRLRVLPPINAPAPQGGVPLTAPAQPGTAATVASTNRPGAWPWIAGLCALGWLLTSLLWWWRARLPEQIHTEAKPRPQTSTRAVLAACSDNNALRARQELLRWLRDQGFNGTIGEWTQRQDSPELSAAISDLESALYSGDRAAGNKVDGDDDIQRWNGSALAAALRALPAKAAAPAADSALPPLYLSR
jgi:hypothetical protein